MPGRRAPPRRSRHASSAGSAYGLPGGIVVHVVELGDRRVARLRHLDVGLRGDRLERVGVDAVEERVHRLRATSRTCRRASAPRVRCARRARAGTRASAGSASPGPAAPRSARRRPRAAPASTATIVPAASMSIATSRAQPLGQQRVGANMRCVTRDPAIRRSTRPAPTRVGRAGCTCNAMRGRGIDCVDDQRVGR